MVNARGNIWGNKILKSARKFIFTAAKKDRQNGARLTARRSCESRLGDWFAKDDLAVHRNDRQDQRETLAVAVGPCGSDFCPETVVAFVGDVPCLEGRGFGFGGGCG
jgi:hypothetical protein